MKSWDELSMAEKADVMKLAVDGGVYDLDSIRSGYNKFAEGGPKYKKSERAYYDKNTDTVYAPDSIGEFYQHEMFHARPDSAELERLKPYYENLNDDRLLELGADLPFVKGMDNDPGHFYSPEEIGARVSAARYMLNNAGVSNVDTAFLEKARKNENAYGDNFRDLLHMYNNENLIGIFGNGYSSGGKIHIDPSKKGTFTAAASKHRMGVQQFASKVLAHPENYSPAMRKKANFARNASKWKHGDGGNLYGGGGFASLITTPILPNVEELRRRLYNGVNPAGYQHIPKRIWEALNGKEANKSIYRDDQWATYLQIPEEERHHGVEKLKPARYKPSKGAPEGDVYRVTLNNEDTDNLIESVQLLGLNTGENTVDRSLDKYFGDHTIGRGYDKKGEYVSYYDKYDLNPFAGGTTIKTGVRKIDKWLKDNTSNIDMSMGIGKPFEIYDRIYLDDYYGVPKEARGATFLPEVTVIGKKKKKALGEKPNKR